MIDDPRGPSPLAYPRTPWPGPATGRAANPWRIAWAAALFVSVTLLLFAVLDGSANGVTVFVGASIVSLGLLIRSARS